MTVETLSVPDVLRSLRTAECGLSDDEALARLRQYGRNELPRARRSFPALFTAQFNDAMVFILLAALAISVALPFVEAGGPPTAGHFLDAFVIGAILLLNAVLGFVQEYRAEKAVEGLRKLSSPVSRVRRGGRERIIPSAELAPGDIVILEAGDRVSADGRIIRASFLQANESNLTGESDVISKQSGPLPEGKRPLADRANTVFSGTLITRGSAAFVVTATGEGTEIGQIADLVTELKLPETPLQKRMGRLGRMLGAVVLAMCVPVLLVGMFQGLSLMQILLIGVSLAVSAVPEGLAAVVTVCLAMGVRRMARQNAIVRRLDALETLGSVTVICADKTGTITENRMEVVETWQSGPGESDLALIAASCNRAELPDIGDPTEVGLLRFARARGIRRLSIEEELVPFSSEEKYMETVHRADGRDRVFLKGAPEKILPLCDSADGARILAQNDAYARRGLRVLACAAREEGEERPRFVGLVALEDPPREEVQNALWEAARAGIRTIMITGDNPLTAEAIARRVGIDGAVILGTEIEELPTEELAERLRTAGVFARVGPGHKLRILESLERSGEIVAMSGDGVNDAPALKGAHVGIAMGQAGTEVAREASSIVLADDNYATIVSAIREGRRIYDNIRKFVVYLLRSNFDELLLITVTMLIGFPLPYLPIHILWINLLTDGLPALALGMEPAEPDIMERPPRNPREHILAGEWAQLAFATLLSFAVTFLFYLWNLRSGVSLAGARSATLTLAIVFELLMAFSVRSRLPFWRSRPLGNPWLIGAVAIPFLLQLVLLYSPLHAAFRLQPLGAGQWLAIAVAASAAFLVVEGMKGAAEPRPLKRTWRCALEKRFFR